MTEIIEPKPEFRALTEAVVLSAIGDADPRNRIAAEVTRLMEAYSAFFDRDGCRIWTDVFRFKPRSPIEAVAMRLAIDAFEAVTVTARLDRQDR